MSRQMSVVDCRYGAPMGRGEADHAQKRPDGALTLFRVDLDNGGYDNGGVYWGLGEPLYCCTYDCYFEVYTRARDRAEAFDKIRVRFPSFDLKLARESKE